MYMMMRRSRREGKGEDTGDDNRKLNVGPTWLYCRLPAAGAVIGGAASEELVVFRVQATLSTLAFGWATSRVAHALLFYLW